MIHTGCFSELIHQTKENKMKINGEEIGGLNEDILVLPRGNGQIIFRGRAIHDFDEFDRLVPLPSAPRMLKKGKQVEDTDDVGYLEQRMVYELKRFAYLTIKTLEPSNIEWETVRLEDPNTWVNWVDEMSKVLSVFEQQKLITFINTVNTLDQKKIDDARNAFLAGLAQAKI